MSRVALLASRQRQGLIYVPPVAIPLGINRFCCYIPRNSFTSRGSGGIVQSFSLDDGGAKQTTLTGLDTEVLRLAVWVSYDDGITWSFGGHVGTTGGDIFVGPTGDLSIDTKFATWLKEPTNPFRKFKATLQLNERLNTGLDVEFFTVPTRVARLDDHQSIAVTDAQDSSANSGTSVSTPNVTPTGDDRYLVAFGANFQYGGTADYTSLVYGAAGMTTKWTNESNYHKHHAAELVAPSTTAAAVTLTIANSDDALFVGAVAFSGVDQSTPSDAAPAMATGTDQTLEINITAGEAGDVRVCLFTHGDNGTPTITIGANETERCNAIAGAGPYQTGYAVSTKADDGTDDMNATIAAATNAWYARGWNINMAGAAPAGTQHQFSLLGCGA